MSTADALLLVNAAATWVMVGVILFVHRVHYPLFDRYARDDYAATEAAHQSRTTAVVFPPMLLELLSSLGLLAEVPAGVPAWQPWLGATLVGVWGFSTALVQVPLHARLEAGFDAAVHRRLVVTNRVRVLAWTAHGALVAVMLGERLSA